MKVVINTCYGGFGLSTEARELYSELSGKEYSDYNGDRSDPHLVLTVERLGAIADGPFAELKVLEIPDGIQWLVEEYDGNEWVAEVHRTWR